ncbi:MAG: nucleoside triphosphate pyrophosphohydrolase [Prevotella sp.]|nr:nucleoside triphosphate pyrophosphohydrolase [Prevotella sp.]
MHTRKEKLAAIGRLLDIQHRLRKECPWDKKQTFDSLRPNTIEEVFELADALIRQDHHEIMKELGDVMEHVMFYSIIGEEDKEFDIADVCHQQADKLMFRHPFIDWNKDEGEWGIDNEPFTVQNPEMRINAQGQAVYRSDDTTNEDHPETASEVEQTWEQIKQKERDGNESVLSGVPASLPSIIKAYRIQDKARNVGFDWEKREEVWTKVHEELGELEAELERGDKERSEHELGDYLFSIINAARLYRLNPDNALEHTNRKFISRFNYIEEQVKTSGRELCDLTLREMDALWNEAKTKEKQSNE